MARYKPYDYRQTKMLPVRFDEQILPALEQAGRVEKTSTSAAKQSSGNEGSGIGSA